MRKNKKVFLRTVYLSSVIVFCLIFGFYGASKAYENTVKTGFGEYKKAVEISDEGLRVFDFEIGF